MVCPRFFFLKSYIHPLFFVDRLLKHFFKFSNSLKRIIWNFYFDLQNLT